MHSEEFGPNIESLVLGLGIANGHDVYAVVSLVHICNFCYRKDRQQYPPNLYS